ncbi:9241_t:CDS:1 [Acaulospora colombiana]|uniref:9241_t:CDS:1 n=1 Tax=Acaulospora colombiana TaxID=27376 RepID=A0ACA9KR32_9GLOM|nr:9241_t:CDS:1 [Acaulospora colombiana]
MQDEYPPMTPPLSSFLSTHKRTMFVSFGVLVYTTPENNAILLSSFVEAIDQGIIDGVIWSLGQTSHSDFPGNITLSNGTIIESSYILHNKHPHIYITDFAPQFALLNQTNVKLFFSHGGTGSTHESIYTAKPMLLLPIAFDQMGNAEKLENAGVGLTVSKFNLNVQDIHNKIKKLQTDESIQVNVRRMQVLARINSKRKHRAADLIEFLLLASQLNNEDEEYDDEEGVTNNGNTLVVEEDSRNGKSINDRNNINDGNGKNNKKNNNNSKSKNNRYNKKRRNGNGINRHSTFTNAYLQELITPDTRMGFIKGKYLDVFGAFAVGIIVVFSTIMWLVWAIASIFVNGVLNVTESFVGGTKVKVE